MASLNGFNSNNVEPQKEFEPIPAGKYLAVIIESVMKPTKNGAGQYLQLTFEILDGAFKGRQLWARLNLKNSNSTTVQIAEQELSAICRAVGVPVVNDSVELHNIPLLITVKQKPRKDNGELTNEIKGYAKRDSGGASAPQAATTTAGNPYAGTTPPWRR